MSVLIVGTGLIGTSIGLALVQAGWRVYLEDAQPGIAAAAAAVGAGELLPADLTGLQSPAVEPDQAKPGLTPDGQAIDLVIVAVQPEDLAQVVAAQLERFPLATVTDVGSVKAEVYRQLADRQADISRYVGSHPMAGSHRSGPLGARADLFRDRTWVITPHDQEDYARTAVIEQLAQLCGSRVVIMSAADHDVAVAQVSHLPQLMSSLVAGRLNAVPYQHLSLAGQGIRDITRIAQSEPELWSQIVALNKAAVRQELELLRGDLADLIDQLDNQAAVRRFINRGREGVTGLPGKHGLDRTQIFEQVIIELPDRPGALAEIFADVLGFGVNVEDVAIEHDLVREVGYLTIAVAGTEPAARLSRQMVDAGWKLRG